MSETGYRPAFKHNQTKIMYHKMILKQQNTKITKINKDITSDYAILSCTLDA